MGRIGQNIKNWRLRRNFTQDDLSKKMGLKKAHISNWELGKNNPSQDNLNLLVKILGVSINDIYGDVAANITDESKFVAEEAQADYSLRQENDSLKELLEVKNEHIRLLKDKIEWLEEKAKKHKL